MGCKEVCGLCGEYGTCSCTLTAEEREERDRPVREAAEAAQRARDEALRAEGRQEGEQRATARIVAWLKREAYRGPGPVYTPWVVAFKAIEAGEHLTTTEAP